MGDGRDGDWGLEEEKDEEDEEAGTVFTLGAVEEDRGIAGVGDGVEGEGNFGAAVIERLGVVSGIISRE